MSENSGDYIVSGRWIAHRPAHTLPDYISPDMGQVLVAPVNTERPNIKHTGKHKFNVYKTLTQKHGSLFPLIGKKTFFIVSIICSILFLCSTEKEFYQIWNLYSNSGRYPIVATLNLDDLAARLRIPHIYTITAIGVIVYLTLLGIVLVGLYARSVYYAKWSLFRPWWQLILFSLPPMTIIGIPLLVYEYSYLLRVLYSQWKIYLVHQKKLRSWLISWSFLHLCVIIVAVQGLFLLVFWIFTHGHMIESKDFSETKPWIVNVIESLSFYHYLNGIGFFKVIICTLFVLSIVNIWYIYSIVKRLASFDYKNFSLRLEGFVENQSNGVVDLKQYVP